MTLCVRFGRTLESCQLDSQQYGYLIQKHHSFRCAKHHRKMLKEIVAEWSLLPPREMYSTVQIQFLVQLKAYLKIICNAKMRKYCERPLFLYFQQFAVKKCYIKSIAYDWIRTLILKCQKRLLSQQCYNHCPFLTDNQSSDYPALVNQFSDLYVHLPFPLRT